MADNYYLTFEEVKWVISEKSILQTDFEGEKPARIYTVRGNNNILHWKKILLMMNNYNAEKKILNSYKSLRFF